MSAIQQSYGRLIDRSARWGFDPVRLRQHLRTAFAACLALLAAWQLGLEHPQWAAMTVWAASQPLRGQLLEKSFFRVAGTVVGTAVGVGLVLLARGDLLWLVLGLAVWLGLCAGVGNLQRSFMAYGTMLSGYSAAMVALLDSGHPDQVFALGWDRLFTALTGVFAALLVGWLFTPRGSGIPGHAEVRQLFSQLLRDLAASLQARGHYALGAQEIASRLLAMAVIEEGLDPHAAGSQRSREAVRALRRLMNAQISALLWLRDAPSQEPPPAFGPDQARQAAEALREAARLLETQPQLHEAAAALVRAREAAQAWPGAADMLAPMGFALQAHLAAAHDFPLPPGHRSHQWPVVLHSDWLGARRAMLRAASAIAIVGLLWVATGWSGGAYMLLGMSIMLTVFSGFENPSATMRHVTLGQAMGVLVALACQWLVWPLAGSQAGLVWLMMPFVFVGALLFSHRRTTLSGYDCNMVLLLLLQPHYPQTASFAHALALGLAVVSGPLAGWAAYRFILPVTLQGRLQGLRAMMVHELQDMAATPRHARDGRIWRARLYHRLLRLVRMSEQAGGQQGSQAAECGLAALHVGRAIQALHQLSEESTLADGTARAVRAALLRLQRLQSAPQDCPPLLDALARRVAPRHPDQARPLRQAAHEIGTHPDFFGTAH
ncbi:MAG: FUSC family protein [Burkholderiaceae bacterium]|jgi:uncharacterized membrane protein YccC|nr:FUSC family protein [Burkholderiaceae bacterium]